MASSQDAWYLSLLGLAEHFRTNEPPNVKECIQCLQAVFNFKPPPRVEARTHLQLGQILFTYTTNLDLVQENLDKAWTMSQGINGFDDVKFEAASSLADLYIQQKRSDLSKQILKKAVELSQHHIYWHCRLLFQLAQIHANEKEYDTAGALLMVGVDYAHVSNAIYTKVLFLLSRVMLLLIERKTSEVPSLLAQAGHLVETWNGSVHQKEYLKLFFLVLQVCHYLMNGQVKSVKPCLKQLQQSIQLITAPNWPSDAVICGPNMCDMFIWMPKDYLYVLVYLVTVMHSMLSGYMDKAQKYTNKAWTQIEKLKVADNKPILSVFQILLLEHIVMCRLVMGNKTLALQEISQASLILKKNPSLFDRHMPQLRILLGLYAMSMNCMEASEAQFITVLNKSNDKELWTFASLNLAIVYLRTKREADFLSLHDRINPESIQSCSHGLRAASYYVQGLQSFFQARYQEAKKHLRETLKMANAEDLNRLTSCSLVLLGHIFLSLGNSRESMNMVTPAMQLASKIPDVHVQLWASAILKDLYRICGDPNKENEAYNMHCTFSHTLLNDHFQATQIAEHNLITWIDGEIPINEKNVSNVLNVQNTTNIPMITATTNHVNLNHIHNHSSNNNVNENLNLGSNSTSRNGSFSSSLSGQITPVFGQRTTADRRTFPSLSSNHISNYNSVHSVFNTNSDMNMPSFLDMSEFPSLTSRNTNSTNDNTNNQANHMPGQKPYVGMVKQPTSEPSEFTMSSEDFPALPGVHSREVSSPGSLNSNNNPMNTNEKSYSTSTSTSIAANTNNQNSNDISHDLNDRSKLDQSLLSNLSKLSLNCQQQQQQHQQSSSLHSQQQQSQHLHQYQSSNGGIQTFLDGRITNIPATMLTDQFGIIGLLAFLRAAEADPAIVQYALGQDLTNLGLHLNSSDNIYSSYAGPWTDHVAKAYEIDYNVPPEYFISASIKDKLLPIKLNRYKDDLLFYLFYNCSGDVLQMASAIELYSREWRYHIEERSWITQVGGAIVQEKTATYERGTYYFFDPLQWRKVQREFLLEYNKLEPRPASI